MTTQVMVVLPRPNHNRVRVTARYRHSDGTLGDVYRSVDLNHGETTPLSEFYVHSSSVIAIEEIE